jgi:nitrate reductase gamma subunit
MVTLVYATAFYAATFFFVFGLARKIVRYARTPAPLKIPTMPAPLTRTGVALRMMREVILFESLFRSNKWIWLFGWVLHVSLAVIALRHLRYFLQPVPELVALIQPLGVVAGFGMVAGLAALWSRRALLPRIRTISAPSDHLMLALLIAIGASGLATKFVAHTDIVQVKTFFLGLMRFDIKPLPTDPALLVHLTLVLALMVIFPISKLLHAPGVFFSPTRNQADDSRDRRHAPPPRLA